MESSLEYPELFITIDYAPNYEVSNYGRVRNIKLNRFLEGRPNICMCVDGKRVKRRVDNLVAFAFHPITETTTYNLCAYVKDNKKQRSADNLFIVNNSWGDMVEYRLSNKI